MEALVNAFRHASASVIEAELCYDGRAVILRLRDNGIGVAPEVLSAGGRKNHWGLPGMRERAAEIGATLTIWSRRNVGTEIELRIPAGVAYGSNMARRAIRYFSNSCNKDGLHNDSCKDDQSAHSG